jgi:PAS domain S-box-containing protein
VPSTQNFRLYGGDITERKKAEELSAALGRVVEQDRNTLQATMESTNAHIAYLGPDFNFIMVNSTYEAGSGHTRGELIGHNHFKFFPNPENEAIFKKARDTGKAVEFKAKPFEFVDQPWRGVTYWDWTLTPVKDELGGVRGLVLSLIDVTVDIRKKQLSDALNDINAVINSTLDFNEVMERVVIDSAKAMRVESAIIALRKGEHWTVKHNYKYPGKIAGVKIADEEMPHMWLAANIKKPVVINDIYTDERVDPKVMETFGLRSVLVLPLVLKEEVIGIISFNYHSGAVTFGDDEVEFTNKLGASVTLAIQNARLYEAEYHIAEALQESLIRPVPKISGLKIGVVYEPAFETEKVGGDFYDIFELEGSLACVLIGDVSGKGVAAAGLTETVRSSVRTLAYVKPSPSFVLGRADQALARQILPEQFVTAVFLVINTETGEILVANAGHPSAALCGSKCTLVDLPLGFPLGLSMGEYEESCLKLREKQTLILYTDGLTEARRGARAFGEGGLLKTLSAIISGEPQKMAEGLLESATAFAEGKLVDDIVVVALRLSKSGNAQPITRLLKNENH